MKILFCSDGSRQAESAVRFGALIAAACKAEPSILGITEKAGREDALRQALVNSQNILKEIRLDAELITKSGSLVREIVKRTMEDRYDLVVIGAACKNPFWRLLDPWWMSPMRAYKIIESVEPPVLVVFCDRPALRRILLCTNGAAYTDKAIQFAGKIAQCIGAVVNLFHVMPEPPAIFADLIRLEEDSPRVLESNSKLSRVLRHQKELLEQFGVFGEIRLRHGQVVPELLKELERSEYDLIVAGSRPANDKLHKYVIGDVTREIVRHAELPVLVIRTAEGQLAHLFKEISAMLFRRLSKSSESPGS